MCGLLSTHVFLFVQFFAVIFEYLMPNFFQARMSSMIFVSICSFYHFIIEPICFIKIDKIFYLFLILVYILLICISIKKSIQYFYSFCSCNVIIWSKCLIWITIDSSICIRSFNLFFKFVVCWRSALISVILLKLDRFSKLENVSRY